MKDIITGILKKIEIEENIEILYACEAGSRVWGFSGENSDYDIRFIYKKANVKDYLSLKTISDVIEYKSDDMDIVGWDIKKAFAMHYKDNPNLREWLISDIVYLDKGIHDLFIDLGDFDKDILKNYYSSIAYNHWRRYSGLEFSKTKTKKYLYVIRAILCWIILTEDAYPPVNIKDLICHEKCLISDEIKGDICKLIEFHQGLAKISEESIFRLNNFILNRLNSMNRVKKDSTKNLEKYDKRFRQSLL